MFFGETQRHSFSERLNALKFKKDVDGVNPGL